MRTGQLRWAMKLVVRSTTTIKAWPSGLTSKDPPPGALGVRIRAMMEWGLGAEGWADSANGSSPAPGASSRDRGSSARPPSASAIFRRRGTRTSSMNFRSRSTLPASVPPGSWSTRTTLLGCWSSGNAFRKTSSPVRLGALAGRKPNSLSWATSSQGGAKYQVPARRRTQAVRKRTQALATTFPRMRNMVGPSGEETKQPGVSATGRTHPVAGPPGW